MKGTEKRILELKAQTKIRIIARMCNEYIQDYIMGRIDRLTFHDSIADFMLLLTEFDEDIERINNDIDSDES